MNGFHRGLEQDPTENKDSYGESDLPCQLRLWTPPDQGQRQRPHATECEDNKGFLKIPSHLFLCKSWVVGGIQKLTAVLTLYSGVLNVFSAEGTLFHFHLSWYNTRAHRLLRAIRVQPFVVQICLGAHYQSDFFEAFKYAYKSASSDDRRCLTWSTYFLCFNSIGILRYSPHMPTQLL